MRAPTDSDFDLPGLTRDLLSAAADLHKLAMETRSMKRHRSRLREVAVVVMTEKMIVEALTARLVELFWDEPG